MKNLLEKTAAWTGRFTFNQKVLLGAILITAALSVVVFTAWIDTEETAVLFTNLSPEDAAMAIDELHKQNVNAELTDGGSTIKVPSNKVHELRVDLAGKGIPADGTVGWGIFDGKQYGMTEFVQNVNFKRALEGELTRTIESITGIRTARVHLVLPKPSIFKRSQSPATASVVVNMGRTVSLTENQINGIQSLVSGSVEGLETAQVSVIDQNGVVLSNHFGNEGFGRSESQLAMKKEVDVYLSQKAESMLDTVLGAGRSIVRVDATLNFEQLQQETESYDPSSSVVRSEERQESSDGAESSNETSVANYEINRTVETVVGEVGGVKALSVAVFVDGRYAEAEAGAEAAYSPLTADELTQIERIVRSAVGLDVERGDRIEVVNMQFKGVEAVPETDSGLMAGPWMNISPELVGRVLLFVVAIVMVLRLRKSLDGMLGAGAGSNGWRAARNHAAAPQSVPSIHEETTAQLGTAQMLDEIKDFAGDNPDEVADLVHAWIKESEGVS